MLAQIGSVMGREDTTYPFTGTLEEIAQKERGSIAHRRVADELVTVLLLVLFEKLAQGRGREKPVPLDRQAKSAADGLQFREPEVAQLRLDAHGKAKEKIVAVKLTGIPCPAAVRREELHDRDRVCSLLLVGVERGEPQPDRLGQ